MNRILIFSGTSDGRLLSEALAKAGKSVAVSVATEYGIEEQGEIAGVEVLSGRLSMPEMQELMRKYDAVVDATHPYAVEVTKNIKAAAEAEGKPYYRLAREESGEYAAMPNVHVCASREEAAERVLQLRDRIAKTAQVRGGKAIGETAAEINHAEKSENAAGEPVTIKKYRVLLTTGSKDLPFYAEKLGAEGLYPRVLPSAESIEICEAAGVPKRNIIAMQGPFSKELNKAVIGQFQIDALVTKDSGAAGGFREKLDAAEECGIACIVIRRPEDKGLGAEEILQKAIESPQSL